MWSSMQLLYISILVTTITAVSLDPKAFRPCFERYPNNRLVGAQPYHSEWRMRTEDNCLQFCAETASRCRSIVFDSVQHICHFFLDSGENVAVPAAKMIYLRVTSKSCLDQSRIQSSQPEVSRQIPAPYIIAQKNDMKKPKVSVSFANNLPSKKSYGSQEWIKKKTPKTTSLDLQKAQSYKGSFESVDDFKRDIRPSDTKQRYMSSMEKLEKADVDVVFTKKRAGFGKLPTSREELTATKTRLETDLRNKLERMKSRYPTNYSEYVGPKPVASPGTFVNYTQTTQRPTTTPIIRTTTVNFNKHNKMHKFKTIQFKENMMFSKKTTHPSEIRRKPSVYEKPSFASYIPKAMSFLETINGKSKNDAVKEMGPIADICGPDDSSIWVTFENSLDSEQVSIDSSSLTKDECRDMCNQLGCKSFSFFEKESQCMINEKSDGVRLKPSPNGDFSASTSVKFCYAKSLPIFRECSTFVGFREYTLDVIPREEFEGLPKGYQGMQLCIELCVLSTDYTCRSASFNVEKGRCTLNAYDSISKPESFRQISQSNQLYIENGCTKVDFFSKEEQSALNIIRVPNIEKSPLKAIQIKKIKNRRKKRF